MKIIMGGKYAYRKDPYTQVRILCVDRPDSIYPVLVMNSDGTLSFHTADGSSYVSDLSDLVPLQEKLPDLWLAMYEDGGIAHFRDKAIAEAWVRGSSSKPKLCKYIPAPDQTS